LDARSVRFFVELCRALSSLSTSEEPSGRTTVTDRTLLTRSEV